MICSQRTSTNQNRETIFAYVRKPFRPIRSSSLCLHASMLLAISRGLTSILSLNWTSWEISHVYKDLQCYEYQKIFLKEKYTSKSQFT